MKRPLLIAITLLLFSSCNLILMSTLFGIDATPNWKTKSQLEKDVRRYEIPTDQSYFEDTVLYRAAILEKKEIRKSKVSPASNRLDSIEIYRANTNAKNDLQPTQIRFFTPDGKPIYKMVNCYIDPPLPISWNKKGSFDAFPPIELPELKEDIDEDLNFFLSNIRTIEGIKVSREDLPVADYYILVVWNDFYKRISRRAIKQIKKYKKQYPDKSMHVLYINNQNAFIYSRLTDEQKAIVKDM